MRYDPEMRQRAIIRYRAECANALAWYNENIAAVWNQYGRPVTSPECAWKLQGVWDAYINMLKIIGGRLDRALSKAETKADIDAMYRELAS